MVAGSCSPPHSPPVVRLRGKEVRMGMQFLVWNGFAEVHSKGHQSGPGTPSVLSAAGAAGCRAGNPHLISVAVTVVQPHDGNSEGRGRK